MDDKYYFPPSFSIYDKHFLIKPVTKPVVNSLSHT